MSYELYKTFYEKRDIKDQLDYINYCIRYDQLKAKHKKLKTKDRRSLEWIDVPLRPTRSMNRYGVSNIQQREYCY